MRVISFSSHLPPEGVLPSVIPHPVKLVSVYIVMPGLTMLRRAKDSNTLFIHQQISWILHLVPYLRQICYSLILALEFFGFSNFYKKNESKGTAEKLLLFITTYFSYLSFFLYLGLTPTRIISQILALMPAVLFILFAGLSPRGMRAFFGFFLLINPWIITGVHSINDILKDLIAECSHMWVQGICKFPKTVSYFCKKWILNQWFSDLTCFQSLNIHWKFFRSSILIISAGHVQYLKFQK